ncbi:uncharacterized protein [Danio rerio]|uniref:Uncharacterized protein n=1 Tax=Danio rerio TaxID=7955 RepID=A0A8M9NYX3_DANRE|nr:uncharacterized protein LOC110437941 [Danio rerio]|eukprot:XP_021322222.1 uncharacterized protein LOC110437941 [Danio rerio]
MKFTLFLNGLLLLFLLPNWTESVEEEGMKDESAEEESVKGQSVKSVDINTLARIINFFEQNYKRVDPDGHVRQYATAINVPVEQCQPDFDLDQNNFLTQETPAIVKNNITDETNALYQGAELIAAGTRKVVITKNKQYNRHSESLLLNPVGNSPMTKLLNKRKDGCSVFYTFESPCVDTCLNPDSKHNILGGLMKWKEHGGIKAFVFKNFWKFDTGKDLQSEFRKIAAIVPLYRCESANECIACKGEGDTAIDSRCLPSNMKKNEL